MAISLVDTVAGESLQSAFSKHNANDLDLKAQIDALARRVGAVEVAGWDPSQNTQRTQADSGLIYTPGAQKLVAAAPFVTKTQQMVVGDYAGYAFTVKRLSDRLALLVYGYQSSAVKVRAIYRKEDGAYTMTDAFVVNGAYSESLMVFAASETTAQILTLYGNTYSNGLNCCDLSIAVASDGTCTITQTGSRSSVPWLNNTNGGYPSQQIGNPSGNRRGLLCGANNNLFIAKAVNSAQSYGGGCALNLMKRTSQLMRGMDLQASNHGSGGANPPPSHDYVGGDCFVVAYASNAGTVQVSLCRLNNDFVQVPDSLEIPGATLNASGYIYVFALSESLVLVRWQDASNNWKRIYLRISADLRLMQNGFLAAPTIPTYFWIRDKADKGLRGRPGTGATLDLTAISVGSDGTEAVGATQSYATTAALTDPDFERMTADKGLIFGRNGSTIYVDAVTLNLQAA